MHVCNLQQEGHAADMETTSLKVPSLVSPNNGLSPAHASGTTATPSAHSVTSQTDRSLSPTVTDSIETCETASKGAICSHQGCLSQAAPSPSVLPPPSMGHNLPVPSLGPCKTTGDPETSPSIASDQASELLDLHAPSPEFHSHVQQEMELVGETEALASTQAPSLVPDHGKDPERECDAEGSPRSSLVALGDGLSEANEATMEVEASSHCSEISDEASGQSIYSPPIQLHGDQTPGQSSAEEQRFNGSMTPAVDLPLSEMPDSTTKVICPLPPSTGVLDGEDSSFSLATALKELHKLLVTSGQGSCRPSPDEKSTSPLDRNDLGGLPCPSSSNKPMSIPNSVSLSVRDEKLLSEPEEVTQGQDLKSQEHQVSKGLGATSADAELPSTKVETITDSELGATLVPTVSEKPLEIMNSLLEAATGEKTVMEAGAGEETMVEAGTGEETITQNQSSGDQPLPIELSGPQSVPAAGASSLFAPSDIEWIVSAGFTIQDAILALEKADGHAEVALLALLAKKIIVPT
ncbi:regulatory solute carrier protein family 1 member 1 isoform X1 [Xenopus laevis]|uniref:Regulatory solute carrier protein family 1 member 1 isoform X1 n=1 Tax=Xenopus laevis TaxID=8355 RepID=A0A8J1LDU6_XENLA|nr:regulatory solute carrier protein family 1 member 1 isoform X1 [Xenopus laevis]